jgi:hypothetical protein
MPGALVQVAVVPDQTLGEGVALVWVAPDDTYAQALHFRMFALAWVDAVPADGFAGQTAPGLGRIAREETGRSDRNQDADQGSGPTRRPSSPAARARRRLERTWHLRAGRLGRARPQGPTLAPSAALLRHPAARGF